MKKIFFSLYIALLAGIASAQVSKTVNCSTAGTLYTLLTKTEYATITNLTVTGNIDARDVYFMRDSMTVLAVLNLQAVQIKAHGTYADNAMPDSSFIKKASLTSIQLPGSLADIGERAFYQCSSLTGNLIIPNAVVSIGNYAFCSGESSQFTGSLTIPNTMTSIGDGAFCGCGFTGDLTIGNSVTSIGEEAFAGCGFTGNINIPNSVSSIGAGAFGGCQKFTGNLTIGNSVTSIGAHAFINCFGLTNLTISNSVTSIGNMAFYNCSGFTGNLTIPNSVTSIGDDAFYYCTGFTGNLIIPNSVISIGGWAFEHCSGFTDLTIPNSVTSIGDYAFYSCSGLQKITVGTVVPLTIAGGVFGSVNKSTCELAVPKGSKAAYQATIYWQDFNNITEVNFVSFNSQGGSAVGDISTYFNTTIVAPTAPTKTGYMFAGWFKEIACTNAWDFAADYVISDTTLYAKWTINSYTVSFNSQGGSAIADLTANYNTTITAPTAPTKTGYTFVGWYKETACNNVWTFATDVVTANTTLYAKWDKNTSIADITITSASVYPNPTTNNLVLKIEGKIPMQYTVSLFDINGRLIEHKKITGNETNIVMSNLESAIYCLKVMDGNKEVKTFMIIKK